MADETVNVQCKDALDLGREGLLYCVREYGHDGLHRGEYSEATKVAWKRPEPAEVAAGVEVGDG